MSTTAGSASGSTTGGGGSATEAKLTRFLIFEPLPDEVCTQVGVPAGTLWTIVGTSDASDRDSAEAKFYSGVGEPVRCSPVSENAWKPRTTKPRQVIPRSRTPLDVDLSKLPSASPRAEPTTGDAPPEVDEPPPDTTVGLAGTASALEESARLDVPEAKGDHDA